MSQLRNRKAERTNYPLPNLSVLFRPSKDWARPNHFGEGNLLYSFKCQSHPKTRTETPRIVFNQLGRYHVAQST